MLGFLNIDKPAGMTSHAVVAQARRGLAVKKVGHAGTLDPLATGVLVLCLGAATRLSEYVMHQTKQYRAQIHLGITTTTYDAEGEVLAERDAAHVTLADVIEKAAQFVGQIQQIPPMYSAIKQEGRKLYQLARAGEMVVLEPRTVQIDVLTVVDWAPPVVTLDITCSAGTYIRSLAHDLGAALGTGGYLAGLTRTASGSFLLADAIPLDNLLAAPRWQDWLIGPRAALPHLPVITVDSAAAARLAHGQMVMDAGAGAGLIAQAYDDQERLIAIVQGDGDGWQPHKVFV
jgi:tRNA pseudouridine55 synthase